MEFWGGGGKRGTYAHLQGQKEIGGLNWQGRVEQEHKRRIYEYRVEQEHKRRIYEYRVEQENKSSRH